MGVISDNFELDFTSADEDDPAKFNVVLGDAVSLDPAYKWEVCLRKFSCCDTFDTLHNQYGRPRITLDVVGLAVDSLWEDVITYCIDIHTHMPIFCSLKSEDDFINEIYACFRGVKMQVKEGNYRLVDLEQLLEIRFNKSDNAYYSRLKVDYLMPTHVRLIITGTDMFNRQLEICNILGKDILWRGLIYLDSYLADGAPVWKRMSDKGSSLLKSFSYMDLKCNVVATSPYIPNRNSSLGVYPMASWLRESKLLKLGIIQKDIRHSHWLPVSLKEFTTVKFRLVQELNGELFTILKASPTNITLAFRRSSQ